MASQNEISLSTIADDDSPPRWIKAYTFQILGQSRWSGALISMNELTNVAKGRIGETLVMLELEYRGWMVFRPDFEEKIDMVAVKAVRRNLFRVCLQVKTSVLTKNYSFKLERRKFLTMPSFYLILCCISDLEKRSASFYVIPSQQVPRVMSKEFRSPSWRKKGGYTFHLPGTKWEAYRNRFDLLVTENPTTSELEPSF